MNFLECFVIFSVGVLCNCLALPKKMYYDMAMAPSYMLEAGYYKNPGAVSAIVTKDLVATNSFPIRADWDESREDYTEKNHQLTNSNENDEEQKWGVKNDKRKGRKPWRDVDDEENDENSWPLMQGRKTPTFASFFPININGGGSQHRSRNAGNAGNNDEAPFYPSGSATAIANAFSTGKGGIATSRATSFGDPNLAAMFLRMNNNVKRYKDY